MVEQEFTTEELASEEWRSVVGWESAYEVSSLGRVRRTRIYNGRGGVLRQHSNGKGYLGMSLYDVPRKRHQYAHRLVAAAFLGEGKPGEEVNHKDGDKANNRVGNLEWVTHKRNSEHAAAAGLMASGPRHVSRVKPERLARGEKNAASRLSEAQAAEILRRVRQGGTAAPIAAEFGVCRQTVDHIRNRLTWKHLP